MIPRILLLSLLVIASASSQVANTARVLGRGDIALGAFAAIPSQGSARLMLDGGFGIGGGYDLGLQARLASGSTYLGFDVEWLLATRSPIISLSLGAHTDAHVGVDGTLLASFPITRTVGLTLGADADVEFMSNSTPLPVWFVLGFDITLRRNLEVTIEVDPALTNDATGLLAAGVRAYF